VVVWTMLTRHNPLFMSSHCSFSVHNSTSVSDGHNMNALDSSYCHILKIKKQNTRVTILCLTINIWKSILLCFTNTFVSKFLIKHLYNCKQRGMKLVPLNVHTGVLLYFLCIWATHLTSLILSSIPATSILFLKTSFLILFNLI